MAARYCLITISATILLLNGAIARAQTDWPTFGFDSQRTGYNPYETVLSVTTVPNLKLQWTQAFACPFTAQPIEGNGVLYVADWCGVIRAVDPGSGKVFWSRQLGASPTSCGDFLPLTSLGILGTPAFDSANNRLFVASGDDQVYALDPATGLDKPGYPVEVMNPPNRAPATAVYGGLLLVGNSLYLTSASGDCENPPFHGQVLQVDVTPGGTPKVIRRWFPMGYNGPSGGGIWGPGGLSLNPQGTALFTATGNAQIFPENAPNGDAVIRLGLNLALQAANSPADLCCQANDIDMGSTPVLYGQACLAVLDKDGTLYVYKRYAINSGPVQELLITPNTEQFTQDVAYDANLGQVYVVNPADDAAGIYRHGVLAFTAASDCTLTLAWQQQFGSSGNPFDNPISPVAANGVVYATRQMDGIVAAFNGETGDYLWSMTAGGPIFGAPSVVNGQVFVTDSNGNLFAFGP